MMKALKKGGAAFVPLLLVFIMLLSPFAAFAVDGGEIAPQASMTLDDYKAMAAALPACDTTDKIAVVGFQKKEFMGSVFIFSDEDCTQMVAASLLVKNSNVTLYGQLTGTTSLTKIDKDAVAYLSDGETYWFKAYNNSGVHQEQYDKCFTVVGNDENKFTIGSKYYTLRFDSLPANTKEFIQRQMGQSVSDYFLGGTATLMSTPDYSLSNISGENITWEQIAWKKIEYVTEGKEPYGAFRWTAFIPEGYTGTLHFQYTANDPRLTGDTYADRYIVVGPGQQDKELGGLKTFSVYAGRDRILRVPSECADDFKVYKKIEHYLPFVEVQPLRTEQNVDGYIDFVFHFCVNDGYYYIISPNTDKNHIKVACSFGWSYDDDTINLLNPATQPGDIVTVCGYSKDTSDYLVDPANFAAGTWTNFDLDNAFRVNNSSMEANLYLNVPDNNYLTLSTNDTYKIQAYRTWQAVSDVVGNSFIEPNFQYTVCGDSVTVEEGGEEGREYATVSAVKEGVSLITVAYDAMLYMHGTRFWPGYYNAILPVNTRAVVVNVGGKNTANIQSNIFSSENCVGSEYDTIYFDKAAFEFAEFTFKPTADVGHTLSVRVHDPVYEGGAVWGNAWTSYTQNEDGSFTVHLKDGRNVIEISAEDDSVQYYVLNCRGVQVNLVNLTREGATNFRVGDTIELSFGDETRISYPNGGGLTLPIQKMAAIYNPNFPAEGWIQYTTDDGKIFKSDQGSQFTTILPSVHKITFTLNESGTLRLIDGRIHNEGLGLPLNSHRDVPEYGLRPNLSAGDIGGRSSFLFSWLPDITINVIDPSESGTGHEVTFSNAANATVRVYNYANVRKMQTSNDGSTIAYELTENDGTEAQATYTWYAERPGYKTQIGTINVLTESTVAIGEWEAVTQTVGTVKVRIVGDNEMPTPLGEVSYDPADMVNLYESGYANFNLGEYSVLHALVDAGTIGNDHKFTCQNGIYTPTCAVNGGAWVCEVTHADGSVAVVDADKLASTAVQDGDVIAYYYKVGQANTHIWFTEESLTAKRGDTVELTLMGHEIGNADVAPVAGVSVTFNGKNYTTDTNGKVSIPTNTSMALQAYTVSAKGTNTTYAETRVKLEKETASSGGSTTPSGMTVSFRLIGATKTTEGDVDFTANGIGNYSGAEYQTWIATTTLSYNTSSVSVGTVFADAMKEAGLKYVGLENNYIESITAPNVLGGYELTEFTNGPRSGWMYTVNGEHPGKGLKEWSVKDGDEIVWHYVMDYSYEVADWFSDDGHISLGDGSTWSNWLKAKDVNPSKPSSGTPSTGTDPDNKDDEVVAPTEGTTVEVTPEATVSNGEAKAEVSSSQITSALTEAKKDENTTAIVIAPEVKGDADKVTVELPKTAVSNVANNSDLAVTVSSDVAEITVTNEGLTELVKETGSTVTLTAENVKDESGKATGEVKIEVAVGDKVIDEVAGGLNIAIPADEDDNGNVMVLVDEDGNETVIKKSVVDEDTAKAIVDGSCTVKVVDNSKDFVDVKDSAWYAGDVDFASSHELFQGVSETQFAPEANMTRAMLATVLFRLEDAAANGTSVFADVPADTWYTDAVVWANGAGIVQGYGSSFGSNDNILRQDLATMLYRYAKTIGMDTTVRGDVKDFKDTDNVADYANDAMRWAVGMGIINGKPGGILDPRGNASRAEVAAMLQRLVKAMLK